MKNICLISLFALLQILTLLIFLFSCIVTVSDGQGALIFIVTIPAMILLLISSWFAARAIGESEKFSFRLEIVPQIFAVLLLLFFTASFVPGLNKIPESFLGLVNTSFEAVTGKTPYTYIRERNSFANLLSRDIERTRDKYIDFSILDVTFAWDKVCIFGPYTSNAKAKSILNLNWNIEEQSKVSQDDSINALVFLFEGEVSGVVDLKRSIVDFKDLNLCFDRTQTSFFIDREDSRQVILRK